MCIERDIPANRTDMDIERGATTAAGVAPGPGISDPSPFKQPGLFFWSRYTQRLLNCLVGSKRGAKVAPAAVELPGLSTAPASPAQTTVYTVAAETSQQQEDVAHSVKGPTHYLGRLLLMYSGALDKYPVATKSISSGIIGLLGDLLAQSVEHVFRGAPAPWDTAAAIWRSCAVMLDGLLINGPLLHYAYEMLEKFMPTGESVWAAVMQVGVDVFVIDPVFAFIFVWSTGIIEGRSVRAEIIQTIVHDYPVMVFWLIAIGLCWAPLQIYLFNRYPVQFRVLTADLIDLVWTCVASFLSHV